MSLCNHPLLFAGIVLLIEEAGCFLDEAVFLGTLFGGKDILRMTKDLLGALISLSSASISKKSVKCQPIKIGGADPFLSNLLLAFQLNRG